MDGAPQTPVDHRRIALGSHEISLAVYAGEGDDLLLLHGIGSSGASWWPVIDDLAPRFRLLVPDWRGHGASDQPGHGYTVPDYAADLDALIAALGLHQPLVMGHSLGGMVALHWAATYPGRAKRLVIEDSPLRRHPDPQTLFDGWLSLAAQPVELTAAHYRTQNPNWTKAEALRRAQNLARTNPAVFTELRDANLPDFSDRIAPLAGIETPTLLIYGDIETRGMVPPEDAARFAATLPNARAAFISGGTHALHRDNREAFLEIALPFLKG